MNTDFRRAKLRDAPIFNTKGKVGLILQKETKGTKIGNSLPHEARPFYAASFSSFASVEFPGSRKDFDSLRFQSGTLKTGCRHGNLKSEIGNPKLSEAWCPPPQPEPKRRQIGFHAADETES